ncbi:SPFH domain-containing protein [Phaeovulum vinaykumarii]|uniref:Membrane protease subunit, stomatin/prohibitin family, contains C-terminal Zn-ribbon domain n=1 Tax=Phaeovulum vinaykumarii TaxID=407234 RepID=A0A1N7JJX5_9RHOB|nr:SPFH domain-containing protein [Phaeovulum vinaykumarii]SIS49619.1 Membrane protease subunit, stomatin/prohibitin family, contains C-terminal Zn-ribbon domain [Phaeovulum vinaykumarii]SOB89798.1 membrane protease subunit (stomatin/prohibitin family) [Phaeovulum vinaykumarii]
MGILDFLTGEFIDVIHWTDDTRDTMVWRFEREGHAIKYGAKLTVREGQTAVFVHEGQLADIFPPGLYELETNNMPVLTTLQHWDHGFQSPFKSEIYFLSTVRFNDLKWGTRNPIMLRDPEFGPVRLRAFGTYSMRITDPGRFMTEIVGTDGEFTADEISFQIRNVIVQAFAQVIAGSGIAVLDMAANTADLSRHILRAIEPVVAAYGLSLPEFYIENISLPPAVEAAMDKRSSMGIVGDLNRYTQFAAAEALAQGDGGGAMGTALGAGLGMAMGAQMGGQMMQPGPWGMAPQPAAAAHPGAQPVTAPPPPPPPEPAWHIARNGATTGPFLRTELAQMVAHGALDPTTLVWSAGLPGWAAAGTVPTLAGLFAPQMPPPPPPPPGGTQG